MLPWTNAGSEGGADGIAKKAGGGPPAGMQSGQWASWSAGDGTPPVPWSSGPACAVQTKSSTAGAMNGATSVTSTAATNVASAAHARVRNDLRRALPWGSIALTRRL